MVGIWGCSKASAEPAAEGGVESMSLCLQGYKLGRILLQHGDLQVLWEEVALLSAVVGNIAVRSRRASQVGRGDPSSHSLLVGGPMFRAQSLHSFGITGAVIPLALHGIAWEEWWNS